MRIVPQSERDRMDKEWEKKRPQILKEAIDKIKQNRKQRQDSDLRGDNANGTTNSKQKEITIEELNERLRKYVEPKPEASEVLYDLKGRTRKQWKRDIKKLKQSPKFE